MSPTIIAETTGPQLIALAIGCALGGLACFAVGKLIIKLINYLKGE